MFNYIEKYYTPYAKQHSESADEIIKALKSNFKAVKNKPINKINNLDIERWRKSRAKDNITFERLKRIYTYLKACINTAVKHYKLIDSFELQHYSLQRKKTERVNPPKVRYLLKDEDTRLLAALDERDQGLRAQRKRYVEWQSIRNSAKKPQALFSDTDYPDYITPIIILAYHTGFDLGDLFDLDWQQHIDFDNHQIRKVRNKTKHHQNNPQLVIVPMTDRVNDVLTQWGQQHGRYGRVFISPVTGGRLDNIRKAWNAVKKSADLKDFRFKDFRHTFGSWLAINGVDLLDIRDLMGHKDIKTTQIYAHLCPKKKMLSTPLSTRDCGLWLLIHAGGFGNAYDKLSHDGRVVDYMFLTLEPLQTGVCNSAGMAIMLGVIGLILPAGFYGFSLCRKRPHTDKT